MTTARPACERAAALDRLTTTSTLDEFIAAFEATCWRQPSVMECVAFRIEQNLWREIFEGKPLDVIEREPDGDARDGR